MGHGEEGWNSLSHEQKIYMPLLSVLMLAISGTMSGLTVAMFSIDFTRLKVAARVGSRKPHSRPGHHHAPVVLTEQERKDRSRAESLLPLLRRGHLTLVTLLVTNTLAMIALPMFLDRMFGPAVALVISVTGLLFFGEVLPQAVFVRHNVAICAACAPLVWFFVFLTGIVSYPMALLLDAAISDTGKEMKRQRLREIIALMEETARMQALEATGGSEGEFAAMTSTTPHEIRLMRGAMALTESKVSHLPIVKAANSYMLSTNDLLTPALLEKLMMEGYSRVPVYLGSNRQQVVGCLIVKTLIALVYCRAGLTTIVRQGSEESLPAAEAHTGATPAPADDKSGEAATPVPATPLSPDIPMVASPGIVAAGPTVSGVMTYPRIGDLYLREPVRVALDSTVQDLYGAFCSGQSHIAAVYDRRGMLYGFATMEDVLEMLHNCEYRDEDDAPVPSPLPASRLTAGPSGLGPRKSSAVPLGREQLMMAVYQSTRRSVAEGLTIHHPNEFVSVNRPPRSGTTPGEPKRGMSTTTSFADAPPAAYSPMGRPADSIAVVAGAAWSGSGPVDGSPRNPRNATMVGTPSTGINAGTSGSHFKASPP